MFGRKKYEDDYRDDDLNEADDNAIGGMFVPPQRLIWVDYLIAAVLGAVAAVFAYLLSYKGLHPDVWADWSVATGLRPATTIAPGYWRLIAGRCVFPLLGPVKGAVAIAILGKVFLGAIVALTYLTFKEILAILVRMIDTENVWCRVLSRCASVVAAILFLCADPVWTLGYAFTPALLEAFLFSLTAFFLVRFLAGGAVVPAYAAMFLLGLLGAETPLGLIALVGFWLIFFILLTKGGLFHVQLLQPLMQQSSKWYLTLFWAVGMLAGLAMNALSFRAFEGMTATGIAAGDLPLSYASQIWHAFTAAATPGAWVIGIGAVLLPFVLTIAMLRRATDLEYFLPYHVGLVFFFFGALAYSQMSSLSPLWFWNLSGAAEYIRVNSRLLLFLCAQMASVAVLAGIAVAAVDAFCRDHRRLAAQYDPDLDDILPEQAHGMRMNWGRLTIFLLAASALIAGSIPGRLQPQTKLMLRLFDDYVDEIVTEAGDAKFLFTDGAFDHAIELESQRRGGSLVCIAAQPSPNARTGYSLVKCLAQKGSERYGAEIGGANILRQWQTGGTTTYPRLDACGLQVGLELWRQRSGKVPPRVSGVIAKTIWKQGDPEVDAGIVRGEALMERILDIYAHGGPKRIAGTHVNDLLLFMQWRLARLARFRSTMFDKDGNGAKAKEHELIAKRLDNDNAEVRKFHAAHIRARQNTARQMTPKEGLYFALQRADFPLAHRYADVILDDEGEEDNPDAHFGAGMDYLMMEQYTQAESHLKRCLVKRDREPTVWNNIAVIQYRQGRYEEALENAKMALSLAPNAMEVQDTLAQIEKALTGKDDAVRPAGERKDEFKDE